MVGVWERVCDFAGEKASFFMLGNPFVTCPAVKVDAKRKSRLPALYTKAGHGPGKNTRQDISSTAFGHSWIPRGVNKSAAVGRGQDGVKSLKDHMRLPSFGGL